MLLIADAIFSNSIKAKSIKELSQEQFFYHNWNINDYSFFATNPLQCSELYIDSVEDSIRGKSYTITKIRKRNRSAYFKNITQYPQEYEIRRFYKK